VPEPDASGRVAGVAGRGLGLLILVVLAWQVLAQGLTLPTGGALGFIHGVNLVFHEAGHVIFGFFGEFVAALGGSLNQMLIPLIVTIAFLRTRQRASAAVVLFWTGQSITDVAIYAADGRARALPLLAEGLIQAGATSSAGSGSSGRPRRWAACCSPPAFSRCWRPS
jgi:hypothetical protein